MITLEIYWAYEFGRKYLRANTNTPDNILGFFLEEDVTGQYSCSVLLPAIQSVINGQEKSYDSVANAFWMHIEGSKAILTNVPVGDWVHEMELDDFQEVLQKWCEVRVD